MLTNVAVETVQTFEILRDEEIAAPIGIVWETVLEQMGPHNQTPDGASLKMVLEAWPGGRWFRDLGDNAGHLWGHVQAIKAPMLLEMCGPLFMSMPATSNVQYRLTEENGVTRLRFTHRAMGWILPDLLDGAKVNAGWSHLLMRIRETAEGRSGKL
jgi:hypothetical protein